jgi:hypothetical protein
MNQDIWQTCMLVPGISMANCSGWLHAWGSLIGLAVAIALPCWWRREDRRHARRFQLAAAEVVAASVLLQNLRVIKVIENLLRRWKDRRGFIIPSVVIGYILDKVQTLEVPNEEQLLPMAAIWPVHVRHVAIAYSSLRIAAAKFEYLAMLVHSGQTVTVEQIDEAMKLLGITRDNLVIAESGIRPHGPRQIRFE